MLRFHRTKTCARVNARYREKLPTKNLLSVKAKQSEVLAVFCLFDVLIRFHTRSSPTDIAAHVKSFSGPKASRNENFTEASMPLNIINFADMAEEKMMEFYEISLP